ncbi:glycosyltransferase [Herbaspirillum sp. meg3]|uniref:glycosyltransferase n=1 Tax=Herbaspirillum sp. meg3 TaxID=2025949 RepID=UPI0018DFA177|nr:glycosyltransferase [Herbaspirillum sp. meg3]
MAALFIDPLIEGERSHGYTSELITSTRKSKLSEVEIAYDLSIRNLFFLPFAFFQICMLIKARKPDVLISHNTKSSPLPLLAAWLMRVKVRVYFNHGVPYVGYAGVMRWILRFFERLNCFLATRILTVSSDMVKLLKHVSDQIQPATILNGSACGLDIDTYNRERYKDSIWRTENRISEDDVVVAFVGRPERRKGFERALHVWANYLKDPKYKLVLCGATPADVSRFLPRVPDNVICLGFVSNIPEILSNSDILIMPSLHEGLSYAVLEAMACGCVVIANDIEGIRSLVLDGQNGYLVKNNALSTYADLIQVVTTEEYNVSNIKRQATITAEMFSRKLFIPAYLSFLNDIARKA